jgi:hypothetical protein
MVEFFFDLIDRTKATLKDKVEDVGYSKYNGKALKEKYLDIYENISKEFKASVYRDLFSCLDSIIGEDFKNLPKAYSINYYSSHPGFKDIRFGEGEKPIPEIEDEEVKSSIEFFYAINSISNENRIPMFSAMEYFKEKKGNEFYLEFSPDEELSFEGFKQKYFLTEDSYYYIQYYNYLCACTWDVKNINYSNNKFNGLWQNKKIKFPSKRITKYFIAAHDNITNIPIANLGLFYVGEKLQPDKVKLIKDIFNSFISIIYDFENKFARESLKIEIYEQQLRTAIISILVDSFAHNISAHSLVALEAWLKQRTLQLENPIYVNDNPQDIKFPNALIDRDELKSISKISEEYYKLLGLDDHTNTNQYLTFADLIRLKGINFEKVITAKVNKIDNKTNLITGGRESYPIPVPIDNVLWHLVRFMKGKAAFWSGITRDLHFGGQHISIFDLLFKEFAENSLYAGTIAATEGIYKLNLKIGLDRNFGIDNANELQLYDFVQINTEIIDEKKEANKNVNDFILDSSIEYSDYGFLRLGKDFKKLRESLSKEIIYMPNSIVGIHAFLTIIENTIRNVKHFKHEYNNMWSNGLTIIITFQKFDLFNIRFGERVNEFPNKDGTSSNYEGKHRLYRTGIAIGHPIKSIDLKDKSNSPFNTIKEKLFKGITDSETGMPQLGGTSQDKICSAMLFNNKFMSVETIDNARDWYVYPWTHPRVISQEDLAEGKTYNEKYSKDARFEMLAEETSLLKNKSDSYKKAEDNMPYNGYLFKFFNIWHGEPIAFEQQDKVNSIPENYIFSFDNQSRFTFLIVDSIEKHEKGFIKRDKKSSERGVYRIIENDRSIFKNTKDVEQSVYQIWNKSILKDINEEINIYELPDSNDITFLDRLFTYNVEGIYFPAYETRKEVGELNFGDIIFTHGSTQEVPDKFKNIVLNYRSHGVLIQNFSEVEIKRRSINNGILAAKEKEFIETLLVQVKIWDDRIFKKIPTENLEKYKKSLRLWFSGEKFEKEITFITDENLENHIIYVVHLSLIEELFKHSGNTKSKIIDWFIDEYFHIIKGKNILKLSICIVTGRGNDEWYQKGISEEHLSYIIFKPIESLTNAVIDAIDFKDDFQLKYNIIKILMG